MGMKVNAIILHFTVKFPLPRELKKNLKTKKGVIKFSN